MEKKKNALLKKLEAFFRADEDVEEVSYFEAKELESSMDVLRVLLTDYGPGLIDLLAEFYFLPLRDAGEVLYFTSTLTIGMELPPEGLSALAGAVSRLNFYLPCGAFSFSAEGEVLIYKSVLPLPADLPEKQLNHLMEVAADKALLIPESYTDLLIRVSDGRLALEDFIEALPH